MIDQQVAVFARVPLEGRVKTRLAHEVGASEALRVYRQLLESTLSRLEPLNCPLQLYADGPGLEDMARQFDMNAMVQQGAGLGMRMANTFDELLQESYAAAIVGVDIPLLDAEYVTDAFEVLADSDVDVVLGPTEDGGYCLIAMNQFHRALFEDISWGTSEVCAQTMARASARGLGLKCARTLWDVDRLSDLERLRVLARG